MAGSGDGSPRCGWTVIQMIKMVDNVFFIIKIVTLVADDGFALQQVAVQLRLAQTMLTNKAFVSCVAFKLYCQHLGWLILEPWNCLGQDKLHHMYYILCSLFVNTLTW